MRFCILLPAAAFFTGCIDSYTPPMTANDRARSRAEVNSIDDDNYRRRDRERRSEAEAIHRANEDAPPVEYHMHNTYAPVNVWQ